MKWKAALILLLLIVLPAQALAAQAEVELKTEPAQPKVGFPHSAQYPSETLITILVKDSTGAPLKGAEVDLEIAHRKSGSILGTGFPWAEGVTILATKARAPDGKLEFAYIFPIRGDYKAKVEVKPTPDTPAFEPITKEFTLDVGERPESVKNAVLLFGVLFLFGGVVGYVFSKR